MLIIPLTVNIHVPHQVSSIVLDVADKINVDEMEIINGYEIVYPWQTVVVDKHTGKGSYIKPVFEKLGGLLYKGKMFGSSDYLVYNIEPGDLETLISESIKAKSEITEKQVKKTEEPGG